MRRWTEGSTISEPAGAVHTKRGRVLIVDLRAMTQAVIRGASTPWQSFGDLAALCVEPIIG